MKTTTHFSIATLLTRIWMGILCLLPVCAHAQAPWLRSKAGFLAQASYHYLPSYTQVFGKSSGTTEDLYYALSEKTVQFYGEYGINKTNTLLVSLPLRHLKSGKNTGLGSAPPVEAGSKWALGNTQIGWRRAIKSGNLKIAGQLVAELPSPSTLDAGGLITGYQALALKPSIAFGRGYRKTYWQSYAGFGWRSAGYSQFVNVGAEAGLKHKKWWFIAGADWQQSLQNGNIQLDTKQVATYLYVNDQSYLALSGKIIYEPSRFVGIVGTYTTAAFAEHLPKSPNMSLGAYFKWD